MANRKGVEDFQFGSRLGEGSYSQVFKAVEVQSRKVYAIKVLSKKHIVKEKKIKYVNIEKSTLNRLGKHAGIVTLYYTFQDENSLYFVIDIAEHGELLTLIRKYGSLSESCSKYYMAQLIDAVAFMHSKGVIHRDLKPENILVNGDMRLMITDFGAAKIIDADEEQNDSNEEKKSSFVGTAEYVSPELLKNNKCGIESDVWAIGCILYQFIVGLPPFKGTTEYLTFEKIVNLDYKWPNFFIPELIKDIVSHLLRLDPKQRLTLDQLKQHPWFGQLQWDSKSQIWGVSPPKMEPYNPRLERINQNVAQLRIKKQPAGTVKKQLLHNTINQIRNEGVYNAMETRPFSYSRSGQSPSQQPAQLQSSPRNGFNSKQVSPQRIQPQRPQPQMSTPMPMPVQQPKIQSPPGNPQLRPPVMMNGGRPASPRSVQRPPQLQTELPRPVISNGSSVTPQSPLSGFVGKRQLATSPSATARSPSLAKPQVSASPTVGSAKKSPLVNEDKPITPPSSSPLEKKPHPLRPLAPSISNGNGVVLSTPSKVGQPLLISKITTQVAQRSQQRPPPLEKLGNTPPQSPVIVHGKPTMTSSKKPPVSNTNGVTKTNGLSSSNGVAPKIPVPKLSTPSSTKMNTIPDAVSSVLRSNEKLIKLDFIHFSELKYSEVRAPGTAKLGLDDMAIHKIIKGNQLTLHANLRMYGLAITDHGNLMLFQQGNLQTIMDVIVDLTDSSFAMYDYEFDEHDGSGYLILELSGKDRLVFLSPLVNKVKNLQCVGLELSWIDALMKTKKLLKKRNMSENSSSATATATAKSTKKPPTPTTPRITTPPPTASTKPRTPQQVQQQNKKFAGGAAAAAFKKKKK